MIHGVILPHPMVCSPRYEGKCRCPQRSSHDGSGRERERERDALREAEGESLGDAPKSETARRIGEGGGSEATELTETITKVMDLVGPYLKSLGMAAERPMLQRLKPEVAIHLLDVRKEAARMEKEVVLEQLAIERERIKVECERARAESTGQKHLLWFSAYALVVFAGIVAVLIYLKHVELALGIMFGLAVYVSVLLGRSLEHTAVVGTVRALMQFKPPGGWKSLLPATEEKTRRRRPTPQAPSPQQDVDADGD